MTASNTTLTAEKLSALDLMSPGELLQRRVTLIARGNGLAQDMEDADLEELVMVFNLIRRRSSGPPSGKTKPSKGPLPLLGSLL